MDWSRVESIAHEAELWGSLTYLLIKATGFAGRTIVPAILRMRSLVPLVDAATVLTALSLFAVIADGILGLIWHSLWGAFFWLAGFGCLIGTLGALLMLVEIARRKLVPFAP